MNELVYLKNDEAVCDSLQVAEKFGKEHKNVLQSIDNLIEEGGNMQTLQKILGHSSLAMTADLYAHVLPNTKQQEMQQIENGFIGVAVL